MIFLKIGLESNSLAQLLQCEDLIRKTGANGVEKLIVCLNHVHVVVGAFDGLAFFALDHTSSLYQHQ
jgi:hypothetical protein